MGQKVNPNGFRLQVRRDWSSSWYIQGSLYSEFVKQDFALRSLIYSSYKKNNCISKVVIERSNSANKDGILASDIEIFIYSSNVGAILGKNSKDIEKLKAQMKKMFGSSTFKVNVIDVKRPDIDANLIALNIAAQLKKRLSFKRVAKKALESARKFDDCLGIKISCAGRLNGAEIAKTEIFKHGSVPLHTLNADVHYGVAESNTTYGIIGIKVWVYLSK
jgi:small subunit ribosomal protein S3